MASRKRKAITTYIILSREQAEKVESIDCFSDSIADEFRNTGALYISSDTHHACWFGKSGLPVDSESLHISFNTLAFEKLKKLPAGKAFGFDPVPWGRKKNVQVFVARDLKPS